MPPLRPAIAALEKRRTDLVRELRATDAQIDQIRGVIADLEGLQARSLEIQSALKQLDASILLLDPSWTPAIPRGVPRLRRSRPR